MTQFSSVVSTSDDLERLYRQPAAGALNKETPVLDQGCRDFIARSTFVLVGTSDTEGHQDVSPRGGPAGFVRTLDQHRLAIPDLNGNNRLDSLHNIINQPYVGLLFLIPGLDETLRLNGSACITTDDAVLGLFDELRRPKTAIGVQIESAYIHCAKSFRRGGIWDPSSWPSAQNRPSAGQILVDHSGAGDTLTGAQLEDILEESYVRDLAADQPQ